jgi:hypothetical protein
MKGFTCAVPLPSLAHSLEPYRLVPGAENSRVLVRLGASVRAAAPRNNGREAGRALTMNLMVKVLAREELTNLFRRSAESGKSYCAACLVTRLSQRFSGAGAHAGVEAAVDKAFEQPGPLRVSPSGTCETCLKPTRCLGNAAD